MGMRMHRIGTLILLRGSFSLTGLVGRVIRLRWETWRERCQRVLLVLKDHHSNKWVSALWNSTNRPDIVTLLTP